jgi:type I restriction enzyme, S subunit
VRYPAYPSYKPSGVTWLGEVPEHWDVKPLGYVIRFQGGATPDKGRTDYWDGDIPWVSPKDMKRFRIGDAEDHISTEGLRNSSLSMVQKGSVLIVVRGMILAHSFPVALTERPVTVDQDMKALLSSWRMEPRFLAITLVGLSRALVSLTDESAHGTRKMETEILSKFRVPSPPLPEQLVIADFIDAQTAKLDTLVAKKRALIEKLREKRSALISRTVTRGLPPDAARAAGLDPQPRLKASGTEWLGEVPAHWQVLPFTKYVDEKSDYRGKTPGKVTDGVFLVTAKNVRMGFIDYEASHEYVAVDEYHEIMRRGLPRTGDILFTTEAPLGNVALVNREDVALAQRIIRFRMDSRCFFPGFTLYAMMSDHFQVQLQSLSTGSTAEGLKASKLPLLRIVSPPLAEQVAIADYLDRETARIDQLVAKVEAAIERLREYRAALISAAVTGKIDVRGFAQPEAAT